MPVADDIVIIYLKIHGKVKDLKMLPTLDKGSPRIVEHLLMNQQELKIRFDIGDPTKNGWKAEDHYHVYNPNSKSWHDFYLDKNGQPCADGSKESHLTPGEYENFLRGIEK